MSQCLRCSKPCEATSVFCESCRSHLRSQLWQSAKTLKEESVNIPPIVALSPENGEVSGDPLERITSPYPIINASNLPQTPPPASPSPPPFEVFNNGSVVEYAVHQLNEAAQRIAHEEPGNRRLPRASRLSPLRDISADIQRQSTPLPLVPGVLDDKHVEIPLADVQQGEDLGKRIPDLWPWLQQDSDESESDNWSGRTDPLMARHFPNSVETARIEEEDLRRAIAEGLVTLPILPQHASGTRRNMRLAFAILAILAVIAIVMDGVLIGVAFLHTRHNVNALNGPPSITLSSNAARVGQTVTLHIHHFSSNTNVYVTHDIQEIVQLTSGSALVKVGPNGGADATLLIDTTWTPGYHTIEAEDVSTRYTASTTLQITGAGPTRPSHLLIGATSLDFGADLQGANTIQSLTLHNSGGGSISWSASSDQPWLLLSPPQGVFSLSQTIAVAVERANLKPGEYKGTITFSSNVGAVEWVQAQMTVRPLPPNVGAVLEIIPPLLSFTALDGESNPVPQALTISNPGSQRLNWSLTGNNPIFLAGQSLLLSEVDTGPGWLSTDQTSGVVVPHSTNVIHALVNSRNLLPGVYTSVLSFASSHGVNSPQSVSVSLTIEPRCGLSLNTGTISFTAVSGQSNPSNQSLGLSATSSCNGVINWKAVSGANWLTVTPASGQLKSSTSTVTAIGVNASFLKPGTYYGDIAFTAAQSTESVMVQLIVQAPPPPSAPIMGATPLSLNFSTTQGLPDPPVQAVTITNTGHSQLNWHTTVNILSSSWLGAGPTGGNIAPGQTGQVTISVSTANLTPNTYVGQIILNGTDTNGNSASGSPQTITVNLLVLPPCVLQPPSSGAVTFSAIQGNTDPIPQTVSINATGNCAWPMSWQATVTKPSSWLKLSALSGFLPGSGQAVPITLTASIAGLQVGTYTAQASVSATNGSVPAQGSPQTFSVTLNVLPPCQLQVVPLSLSFSVPQGQPSPPTQTFSLSEVGTCAPPVSWLASGDPGSSSWLVLGPPTSGVGSATVTVGVAPQSLPPGTYTGTITVSASGNGGAIVLGSPQPVAVTLTVTGYILSGMINACSDTQCSSSQPLPGASLSLLNTTTNQTFTTTADGSGKYSFGNLPTGPYTLTVNGTIGSQNYFGTASFPLSGNQVNFPVNVYPK